MSDEIDIVLAELEAVGIKGRVETGRKHPSVYWTPPGGSEERTICAGSSSDVRAGMNQRAFIRRRLRELGLLGADAGEPSSTEAASVVLRDGAASVTSLIIARDFAKAHKDVLRAIDRVRTDIGPEFDQRNFAPISYLDEKGRTYRAYSMSRDGFVMVCMGFTGPAAANWKARYIDAFNAMEAELARLARPANEDPRIAQMRGDLDALTDLVLSLPAPARPSRGPWVNPIHIYRQQRAERRERRRA